MLRLAHHVLENRTLLIEVLRMLHQHDVFIRIANASDDDNVVLYKARDAAAKAVRRVLDRERERRAQRGPDRGFTGLGCFFRSSANLG